MDPLTPSMDIEQCLALVPAVPCLHTTFTALRYIWSSVQRVQGSKRQLQVLTLRIAQVLHTLDSEFRAGRLAESSALNATLADLNKSVFSSI